MVKTRIIMKIKSFISLVGLCAFTGLLSPTESMAQKQFTLEDLNFGGKNFYNMRPEARYLTWWGGKLVRQDLNNCSLVDLVTGKETPLFSLDDINNGQVYQLRMRLFVISMVLNSLMLIALL